MTWNPEDHASPEVKAAIKAIENTDSEQIERLNARVSELLSEVAKAKGALAYLIDHIEYNDSYGVEGSCFQACHLCRGGGAPGIRLEHEATCPIRRCAEIAQERVEDGK